MTYFDLSIPMRSLLILAFFLALCIGGCLIPMAFRRRMPLSRILLPVGTAISGAALVLYTAEARATLLQLSLPGASRWFCSLPLAFSLVWIVLLAAYFALLFRNEWNYRRNTITRSSIKEGVDKISSGLCFYVKGGRTILVNQRMHGLCYQIFGRDLQNAELFWEMLRDGGALPGAERLHCGDQPTLRLPDGSVWTFARDELNGFFQLTAANTTLQQRLTDELQEKNANLADMNLRLRCYGENVDELTRARERLETKVRIHGELGQALLAARRYLVQQNAQEPPVEVWRRSIAMLRKEAEERREDDPLEILRRAAASAGVVLHIDGELPDGMEVRQFFLTAASEAMTNAVFHANAKDVYIALRRNGQAWKMRFTNNGTRPDRPIVEGGGLGSLRRKAEYIGAGMTVESAPEFALSFEGGRE